MPEVSPEPIAHRELCDRRSLSEIAPKLNAG